MDNKITLTWFILAVVSRFHGINAQCPSGCDCKEPNFITCTGLNSFPDIPDTTEEINFYSCSFQTIASLPPGYGNVQKLIIGNSGVMNISDGAFSNLKTLTTLDLLNNHLQHLRPQMFTGLSTLTYLNLDKNEVYAIKEGLLTEMPSLTHLSLEGNNGIIIHENAFKGSKIKHLNLDNCNLKVVPTASFVGLTTLTRLDLGKNPLRTLGKEAFKDLENLEGLHLPKCQLSFLDKHAFEDLHKLKELNLAYNNLTSLDDDIFDDSEHTLIELNLAHNLLETIEHDVMDYKKVSELQLEGNPLKCDCNIYWMKDAHFSEGQNVTCFSPSELSGMDVKNVTTTMDCVCGVYGCDDKTKIALYIAIPILIVCVLLIGYYVYKIIQNKRKRNERKSGRYSEVYKDTTVTMN